MRIFTSRDPLGREYAAGYSGQFPKGSVLRAIESATIDQAMAPLPRWYGVSTGDGNNGVSHMFPDYYVFTADPWRLCERAAESSLRPGVEFEVDGEADYCISAVVYDSPEFYDDVSEEDMEDFEAGPCPFILDVFPVEQSEVDAARADPWGKLCYGSIAQALGE